jgi:CHASE1-domain containing sensor protein
MITRSQPPAAMKPQAAGAASSHAGRRCLRWVHGFLARPAAAWLLLGLGLLVSLVATLGAWWQIHSRDEARFLARTEAYRAALQQEFDRYVQVLNSARALWQIHPPTESEEWRKYVQSLDLADRFPGLHALGYVARVPSAQLPGFVEEVRRVETHGPAPSAFRVHPQSESEEHYVVRYIEPLASNRAALGYDVGSEPIRRQAANHARDRGTATLTPKLALVQAPQAPGVLLLLPVYTAGLPTTNVALRRAALSGWV